MRFFLGSALSFWGFVLVGCQTSVKEVATPIPTPANAAVSGKSYETLTRGHGVYMKNCAQCHEHRLPNEASLPAWHQKIDSMSELAGLSKNEEKDLQAYLGEFSDR